MENKKRSSHTPSSPRPEKKVLSKEARQRAYLLIVNTVILLFIYFGTMESEIVVIPAGIITQAPVMLGAIVCMAYWAAFAGFLLAYIIYNRAFSRKGVTEDMLPPTWSNEKKREYIDSAKEKLEKSKWMLSVLIPLIITIGVDAIYLFTWPLIQGIFP